MKALSAELAAHLNSGATTLCRCWKVVLTDGSVLGFTDHDRTVSLDGLACEPASGFTATEAVTELGLSVGGLDIDGALASERITEADLIGGLYDGAAVEVWLVNWSDPSEKLLLRRGEVGEITRADGAFRAEIRSLSHSLDQQQGRQFQFLCDADLGDPQCKVDLAGAAYKATATVGTAIDNRNFTATGLESFASDWFSRGLVTWTGGLNTGRAVEVRTHSIAPGGARIELWQTMSEQVAAADTFIITAGCDKRFATCREKFANSINYRGFPHMPGNDFALSYPRRGDGRNDGGSMN